MNNFSKIHHSSLIKKLIMFMTGLFLYTFLIYPDDRIHGIWVFAVIIPVAFAAMRWFIISKACNDLSEFKSNANDRMQCTSRNGLQ